MSHNSTTSEVQGDSGNCLGALKQSGRDKSRCTVSDPAEADKMYVLKTWTIMFV